MTHKAILKLAGYEVGHEQFWGYRWTFKPSLVICNYGYKTEQAAWQAAWRHYQKGLENDG